MPRKFSIISLGVILCSFGIYLVRQNHCDGKTRFTRINLTDPVTVESFDPATNEGLKLKLPSNLEIDSLGEHGTWLAKALPDAAKKFGFTWATDSVADYLGILYQANISVLDKLVWSYKTRTVDWKEIILGETKYVSGRKAPDGLEVYHLTSAWDLQAQKWFGSQKIAQEQLPVTVINTTTKAGLGSHLARPLENAGIKVVQVKTQEDHLGTKCKIVSDRDRKKALSIDLVMRSWGCVWQEDTSLGRDWLLFVQ